MKLSMLLTLLLLSHAAASEPLLSRDFSKQLPAAVAKEEGRPEIFLVTLGDKSEPTVRLSLQLVGTNCFKAVTVDLHSNPGGHQVSADLGNPMNAGTQDSPLMQVPLKITWSRSGITGFRSRTDLYQLSALGCKKQR